MNLSNENISVDGEGYAAALCEFEAIEGYPFFVKTPIGIYVSRRGKFDGNPGGFVLRYDIEGKVLSVTFCKNDDNESICVYESEDCKRRKVR